MTPTPSSASRARAERAWRTIHEYGRRLDGNNIVVRTRFSDYFLLTLEPACASDLMF